MTKRLFVGLLIGLISNLFSITSVFAYETPTIPWGIPASAEIAFLDMGHGDGTGKCYPIDPDTGWDPLKYDYANLPYDCAEPVPEDWCLVFEYQGSKNWWFDMFAWDTDHSDCGDVLGHAVDTIANWMYEAVEDNEGETNFVLPETLPEMTGGAFQTGSGYWNADHWTIELKTPGGDTFYYDCTSAKFDDCELMGYQDPSGWHGS